MINRRGALGQLLTAPFIIRSPGLLMPIRPVLEDIKFKTLVWSYWSADALPSESVAIAAYEAVMKKKIDFTPIFEPG